MGITEKLMHIQTQIKAPKNLYNSFGRYKYRNAEGICEAAKPYLKKEGCSLTLGDEIVEVGGRVYVMSTALLRDIESGEEVLVSAYAREALEKKGMDDSQITGTASSYARKYALNGLFLLDDAKDADDGNIAAEFDAEFEKIQNMKISAVKVNSLKARCKTDDVKEDVIKKLYKVNNISDLTEIQYRNINDNWNKILELK